MPTLVFDAEDGTPDDAMNESEGDCAGATGMSRDGSRGGSG